MSGIKRSLIGAGVTAAAVGLSVGLLGLVPESSVSAADVKVSDPTSIVMIVNRDSNDLSYMDIKTQKIIAHPDLTKSVVAVDEEQGIALLWMNFGDTGTYGAGNALIVFEAFKVFGGQIHAVEAFMKVMPKDTKRGWGKTQGGLE